MTNVLYVGGGREITAVFLHEHVFLLTEWDPSVLAAWDRSSLFAWTCPFAHGERSKRARMQQSCRMNMPVSAWREIQVCSRHENAESFRSNMCLYSLWAHGVRSKCARGSRTRFLLHEHVFLRTEVAWRERWEMRVREACSLCENAAGFHCMNNPEHVSMRTEVARRDRKRSKHARGARTCENAAVNYLLQEHASLRTEKDPTQACSRREIAAAAVFIWLHGHASLHTEGDPSVLVAWECSSLFAWTCLFVQGVRSMQLCSRRENAAFLVLYTHACLFAHGEIEFPACSRKNTAVSLMQLHAPHAAMRAIHVFLRYWCVRVACDAAEEPCWRMNMSVRSEEQHSTPHVKGMRVLPCALRARCCWVTWVGTCFFAHAGRDAANACRAYEKHANCGTGAWRKRLSRTQGARTQQSTNIFLHIFAHDGVCTCACETGSLMHDLAILGLCLSTGPTPGNVRPDTRSANAAVRERICHHMNHMPLRSFAHSQLGHMQEPWNKTLSWRCCWADILAVGLSRPCRPNPICRRVWASFQYLYHMSFPIPWCSTVRGLSLSLDMGSALNTLSRNLYKRTYLVAGV